MIQAKTLLNPKIYLMLKAFQIRSSGERDTESDLSFLWDVNQPFLADHVFSQYFMFIFQNFAGTSSFSVLEFFFKRSKKAYCKRQKQVFAMKCLYLFFHLTL